MAIDNSTSQPKPEVCYFDAPAHAPRIDTLILALDGVCQSLYAWDGSTDDDEEVNRIANLSAAAAILSRELMMRKSSKPITKRQLEEGRKARAEWLAAREQLAGPVEGRA